MSATENFPRLRRLIRLAIDEFELDLRGLRVLTEVGSGAFVVTPVIAALAGAEEVFAVTRDSSYGNASAIINYGKQVGNACDAGASIHFSSEPPASFASLVDIITNLGFVRPIDRTFISRLKHTAVIPLMWEPWEFRATDLDIHACMEFGIPVIGTCETDSRLRTFEFVGVLALKLLLERSIELIGSKILVVGSAPFGQAVRDKLFSMGTNAELVPVEQLGDEVLEEELYAGLDAIVLVEHKSSMCLVGDNAPLKPAFIRRHAIELIHICGGIDYESAARAEVEIFPNRKVSHGYMTVTTDYVGPKPVVYLHCAGLKVAEIAARMRIAGGGVSEAIKAAEGSGLGLGMEIYGK